MTDDVFEQWLEKCDDALAAGRAIEDVLPADVSPELAERLRRAGAVLRVLDYDRAASTSDEKATPVHVPSSASIPHLTLPGYEVLELLGRGGMGVVFKARQIRAERIVAVKMIRFGLHQDRNLRDRFHKEARALGQLQHANIVQIYDVAEADDCPYFVMEFVEGRNLAEKLAGKPCDARVAAQILEQLARAMAAAHRRGILHRDLKPNNVLIAAGGTPKISDFGLAKHLGEDTAQTASGDVLGTPSYMAPEQAAGKTREIGPKTDIYSLGAILYEMLTGRAPFRGKTALETIQQVISKPPAPPRRLQKDIPPTLEAICLKCLDKKPAQRYPSADDLADDLRRWLDDQTPVHVRLRRYRGALVAMATALLIVAGSGLMALYYPLRQPEPVVQVSLPSKIQNPTPPEAPPKTVVADPPKKDRLPGPEVRLLGKDGRPLAGNWIIGRGTERMQLIDGRETLTLSATSPAIFELVPQVELPTYEFEAEVKHLEKFSTSVVGIAFGSSHSKAGGRVCTLSMCDIGLGRGSVKLFARRFGSSGGIKAIGQQHFPPKSSGTQWHKLKLGMHEAEMTMHYDGEEAMRISYVDLSTHVEFLFQPLKLQDSFTPQGGVGLLVDGGTAAFRNVAIRPLN